MTTINTLPQPLLAEIFAQIPDTGLRLVCKLWKQTFDGSDFKTIMGKLYDKWIHATPFWESIQSSWQKIFRLPLPNDLFGSEKMTWAQHAEKIVKFIYLQNPAMIAFCRANLNRAQPTLLLKEMQTHIWEADDKKAASKEVRARFREECIFTVFSAKEDALINMLSVSRIKKPEEASSSERGISVGKLLKDIQLFLFPIKKEKTIEGNLSIESLELLSRAQVVDLMRVEGYANSRLK